MILTTTKQEMEREMGGDILTNSSRFVADSLDQSSAAVGLVGTAVSKSSRHVTGMLKKKNKDAPPNAYLGSYHPHKDEARTVDVLNVSLGYDCAWVMHLDEKMRCTREVLMGENHQRSKQAFLDGKPMSGWRPCRGCTTFTLRSGDLVWFEGAKVVHGVGYCYPGEQPDWTPSWLKNRRVSIGMRLERGNREEVQ